MPDLLVGFFMYPFHGPSAWFVYVLESGIPRKSFNGRIVFFYVKKDIYLQRFFRKAPDIAEKTVAEMAQLVEQFIRNE